MALTNRLVFNPFNWKFAARYGFPLFTRFFTGRVGGDEWLFLNWAYEEDPPMALPLAASDEPNRF